MMLNLRWLPISLLCIVFSLQSSGLSAQAKGPDPAYRLVTAGSDFISSKNYYLLTLFQVLPDVKKLLSSDAQLAAITKVKRDSLSAALLNCGRDGNGYIERMKFSPAEINAISKRLGELYQPQNALGKLVSNHLIASGRYIRLQNLSPKEMLVKAWEQDANGINFCVGVYAGGSKPNYPLIDSISFTTRDSRDSLTYLRSYVNLLYDAASLVATDSADNISFFSDPLSAALLFLEMNERTQAADFEPMEERENKAAVDKIKTLDWNKYKYSVILVPGAGPDQPNVSLSAEGMIRCRLAALQYQKGLAPFIMPSGGKVHPCKTNYCEAIEMKKYLVEKLHVPAGAIIIEPHARHTTTNMRNAARLMYRYGMPFSKPGVTCTTKAQSAWIGTTLTGRCQRELNEIPYKSGQRLDENVVEFYPLTAALQSNPEEPMDP